MDIFKQAQLAVVLTAHGKFQIFDPKKVGSLMSRRIVLDTHAILSKENWIAAGFEHHLLGVGE